MTIDLDKEFLVKHFRVTIFGSARIARGDPIYNTIFELAKMISEAGMDLVTGGGPGLMNAASEGHYAGRKNDKVHSVGLRINLPFEQELAAHLDIKKEFDRFSNRLDNFVRLSDSVVAAPGGVGTLLEVAYTWQLMQVRQICNVPIILLGDMWTDFINWIKKWPLRNKLLNQEDVELLFLAKNPKEAFAIIQEAFNAYKRKDAKFCLNYHKYKA
ncbi:LOG family protein [[Eubacterium] cellulosolvens]